MNTDAKDLVKLHVIPGFNLPGLFLKNCIQKVALFNQPKKEKKKVITKGTHETLILFHSLLMLGYFYAITYSDP